jgi:predicted O-methyltransferase YrrM
MEHVFTQDWFTHNTTNFNDCKTRLVKSFNEVNSILEIGCHEGRATCWMLDNMLSDKGTITCIDPFLGVDDPDQADPGLRYKPLEDRFNYNVAISKKSTQTVNVIPSGSYTALATLITAREQYDFIYVDGDHAGEGALTDACMSWGLLRQGGIMLFDDYFWDHVPDILDRPKAAIDAFMNTFTRRFKVTGVGYQIAIQKL